MVELCCTVRACNGRLSLRDTALVCPAGHAFDRSREGYWSLLQPQDRRSIRPGDSDAAVAARRRWLDRGFAASLAAQLRPWCAAPDSPGIFRAVDLGCGEGYFGRSLFSQHESGFCGIDLSKRALKLAARSWPGATWILANADRGIPLADTSMDRVVSLFGRRPVAEMRRVLLGTGRCIVAIPGADDLIELREQVQISGVRRRRWENVAQEMSAEFELVERKNWTERVQLDHGAVQDALAMTYRGARKSEQARLENRLERSVTLAADLLLFRPSAGSPAAI